jgi:hypothetical protein
MILLKEIERNPHGVNTSSLRSLVDQTIALCGPDGGVIGTREYSVVRRPLTDGGKEAWELITRLRSKIWIMAGLNPENLPLRQQVAQHSEDQLTTILDTMSSNFDPVALSTAAESFPSITDSLTSSGMGSPSVNWEDWDGVFGSIG